jgi:hypothetical protein
MSERKFPERFVICFTNEGTQAVVHRAGSDCFSNYPDFDAETTLWTQPKAGGERVFRFGSRLLNSKDPSKIDWCPWCCKEEKASGLGR